MKHIRKLMRDGGRERGDRQERNEERELRKGEQNRKEGWQWSGEPVIGGGQQEGWKAGGIVSGKSAELEEKRKRVTFPSLWW